MTARESAKQALELICSSCDPHASCEFCRLRQFDLTLELISQGRSPQQAVALSSDAMKQGLRKIQEKYDREYGLVEV